MLPCSDKDFFPQIPFVRKEWQGSCEPEAIWVIIQGSAYSNQWQHLDFVYGTLSTNAKDKRGTIGIVKQIGIL